LLERELNFPMTVAQDPMSCVALGVGRMLDELEVLEKVALPG
jgi:actin-like ATPase involved in cell morphogenesis